jgi:hypothetical protein
MQNTLGNWIVKIALGAILFVGIRFVLLNQVTHSMTDISNAAQQGLARTTAQFQADAARRAAQVEHDKQAKLAADAARISAAAEAAAQKAAVQQAKELAWKQYYTAPKECEHPPSWEAQVECGNKYIRAKRSFEAQYSVGMPAG